MPLSRPIRMILKRQPTIEGAGVHLHRVFGFHELPQFDPFLMLDDFRSDIPAHYLKGFPWHPHRGIETITYVLKGEVEHGDSLGNKGIIRAGDVQWMTAGSGIIHQEMPRGDADGAIHGFQLWANLPAAQKMMTPRYRGITSDAIPRVELENGIEAKIIAGEIGGVKGPVNDIIINPEYFDCVVPGGIVFKHSTDPDYTAAIYVIAGRGTTEGKDISNGTLVLYDNGRQISIQAKKTALRFLLLTGKPLHEPVAWQGPIVMNTRSELNMAFQEYRNGTFIKSG